MENKVIKNMEYWKKKNNIPGIEALADSGLTDGRAGSSAFQMASPESSPNKFVGLAAGGMIGAALSRKNSQDEGPQELLSGTGKTVEKVTGFKVSGGEGTDVAGGAGAADGEVAQPVAEDPNTALTMRSPAKQDEKVGTRVGTEMDPVRSTVGTREQKDEKAQESETPVKQEEGKKEGVLGGQEIAKMSGDEKGGYSLDEENGQLMTTDQFGGKEGVLINDPNDILEGRTLGDDDFDYRYKVEEDGSYTLISKGETGGVESPSEENVPTGPMGPGGMGGVGEIKTGI